MFCSIYLLHLCTLKNEMNKKDKARARRIIQIFRESELTQREFSMVIGVSQQLVSAVLNYRKKPNENILFGIIDKIPEVNPLWLLTGKEIRDNDPLNSYSKPLIENYLDIIVKKRVERLADDILKYQLSELILDKLSNIESMIQNTEIPLKEGDN